jgi:hypothetical protein
MKKCREWAAKFHRWPTKWAAKFHEGLLRVSNGLQKFPPGKGIGFSKLI